MISNSAAIEALLTEEGFLGDVQLSQVADYNAYFIYGYFKPPRTGDYKFFLSGDDTAEFYLSPNNKDTTRSTMVRTAYLCNYNYLRNYDFPAAYCDKGVSDPVTLT